MSKSLESLQAEVEQLKRQMIEVRSLLKMDSQSVRRPWESNLVVDWMIKLVYPGIYREKDTPSAGFPQNRRKVAAQIKGGQWMFVYVTSPIRKIIGLARVTGPMRVLGGADERWPFNVPLQWEIGPKLDGVTLLEVGLDIRPRPGDTLYGITPDIAEEIKKRLNMQPDLTPSQWDYLIRQYREEYREVVPHEEAVRRLRYAGYNASADELETWYAGDGTRRGWDEFASKGHFHIKYPYARRVIWPQAYGNDN
ncbi:hypothetical protein [Cohnella sp. GCM10027633]|uniref:hypothetical protein n=1 Tax=unclassified Cohnella TaxID=2636738 RepID=UPI0036426129